MKTEAPPDRRKFVDQRDELDYLYHKLLYWLYQRQDLPRSRAFARRLALLVDRASPGHDGIFGEECRSLICETRKDLAGAIKHRENEVKLIKRLHQISRNTPQEETIFRLYGYQDLSDRLDLLAVLYHERGDLDKAISMVLESKRLCEKHRVEFDGEDILQECLEEKRNSEGHRNGKLRMRKNAAGVVSGRDR